jgi:hypothetical protein
MRFLNVVVCWMSVGLQMQAHAQTFNTRYDAWERADFGWAIERLSDTSFVVFSNSAYADSLFYSSVLTSIRIGPSGEYLDTNRLHIAGRASYAGWANASGPMTTGSGIIGGSTYAEGDTNRASLYRYDHTGAVVQLWELDLPGRSWIGRQAKQTPDGGYVLCGETSTVGFVNAFLTKTDPLGSIQWVQTYGGDYTDYATSVDMDPAMGGYFTGGQHRETSTNHQLWVQSLNDTGAVQWSKIWGSAFDEVQAHVTTLNDGNVLVASNWGTAVGNSVKYLAKLDRADGTILWSRSYGASCQGCLLLVGQEITPGGDLIAVGHTWVPGSSYFGSLLRTTSDGDSLWMRNYQYSDELVSDGRGLLYDVQPTPDGGFIAVGVALAVAGQYTQDVWVVKTDSMGCIEPGCHLVTGMESQITNLKDALRVWPNPVERGSSVQVSIDLPVNFQPQGALRLSVVSSDGRLVQEQSIPDNNSMYHLNTNLSAGIYHIHLSDASRWISGAELVVH